MPRPRPACGTRNGYVAHRRHGEDACVACLAAAAEYRKVNQARRLQDGWRIVHGKFTKLPLTRIARRPGEEPPHGSQARYRWRQDPCRCAPCTAANTAALARYRRMRNANAS